MRKYFRYLAKALGSKEGNSDKEANIVASIRLFFILQCIITNCFIVASSIKNLFGG